MLLKHIIFKQSKLFLTAMYYFIFQECIEYNCHGIIWNPLPFFQLFLQGWAYLRLCLPLTPNERGCHNELQTSHSCPKRSSPNCHCDSQDPNDSDSIRGNSRSLDWALGEFYIMIRRMCACFLPGWNQFPRLTTVQSTVLYCAFRFQYAVEISGISRRFFPSQTKFIQILRQNFQFLRKLPKWCHDKKCLNSTSAGRIALAILMESLVWRLLKQGSSWLVINQGRLFVCVNDVSFTHSLSFNFWRLLVFSHEFPKNNHKQFTTHHHTLSWWFFGASPILEI